MHILVTLAVLSIFALGIYFNQRPIKNADFTTSNENSVLSESTQEESKISPTPTVGDTPSTPTSTPAPSNNSLEKYIYPNATVTQSSDNNINLTTTDDPKVVTEWYRNKIIESGLSVRSFVTTSANNNILNKLAGADAESEISIEIKKDVNDSLVTISVSLEV